MKQLQLISTILLFPMFVFAQNPGHVHFNKIIAKLERSQLVNGIWVSALHPSNANIGCFCSGMMFSMMV